MNEQTLLCWIGHADTSAMCQDFSERKAEKIFQQAQLLSNYPAKVSQQYAKLLGRKCAAPTMTLNEPSDEKVFLASGGLLIHHF